MIKVRGAQQISSAFKLLVTALGPVLNTVICADPLTQYCHSSAFGGQCISRMPPGWTVTSPAATMIEALKLWLSAIWATPPAVCLAVGPREGE
jgi:hypothetical protein